MAELAARHNMFVADATTEFRSTHGKFQQVNSWSLNVEDKVTMIDKTLMGHDQRIMSNDSWLRAVCKDVQDQLPIMFNKAEAIASQGKLEVHLPRLC